MSFGSLVSKLVKEGKSKEAATKIAGSIANAKMKGAGSGPTAKQKARSNSAAKMIGPQGLGKKGNNGYSIGSPNAMKNTGGRFKEIVKELKGASKMHLKQSKDLAKMTKDNSPLDLKDACYKKVKAQYKVFPSAYASGAIAKCRKNKGKK